MSRTGTSASAGTSTSGRTSAAPAAATDPTRALPGRVPQGQVLLVASSGAFLAFLDATIVNVAFPSIRESFAGTSIGDLSWVLNAYNIVFAAFLVVFGRLADLLGRRRIFTAGVAVFTVASVACGLATSVELLVVARVVQALGAALLVPASLALVVQAFPVDKRGHAVGLWGATAASPPGSVRRSAARSSRSVAGAGRSSSTCRSAPRPWSQRAARSSRAAPRAAADCRTCAARRCWPQPSAGSTSRSSRATAGAGPRSRRRQSSSSAPCCSPGSWPARGGTAVRCSTRSSCGSGRSPSPTSRRSSPGSAGIAVDRVAGCSIGAAIAGGHATGMGSDEVEAHAYQEWVRRRPFGDYAVPLVALARGRRFRDSLSRCAGEDTVIEGLPRQFRCVSTDLSTRSRFVHDRGSLVTALRASAGLPVLLPPVVDGPRLLVDGGVLDNLPVDLLTERDEGPVVAVNISLGGGGGTSRAALPVPRGSRPWARR